VEATFELFWGYNVYGHLAFNTLFQFSPFRFTADFVAEIALRQGTQWKMAIFLSALLEGPTPWHVRGVAKARFFFIDVSVDVDVYFGQRQYQPLPIVDPTDAVIEALQHNGSWQRAPGSGASSLVVFDDDASAQSSLLVDPNDPSLGHVLLLNPEDGVITRQNVVPLKQEITRFGNAAVQPPVMYDIVVPLDPALTYTDLFGHYAPGQFRVMTMHERLSARDFELCKDGIQISNDSFDCGADTSPLIPGYEEKELERERGTAKRIGRAAFQSPILGRAAMRQVAGSKSRRGTKGARRFHESAVEPAVKMPELVLKSAAKRGGA
jgi:hypothetical protein